MMSKFVSSSLVCLATIHCFLVVASEAEPLGSLRSYLSLVRQAQLRGGHEGKPHHLVRRLPPLVPPSFGDDDHFDERQVYSIPRVGKSIDNMDLYSLGLGSSGVAELREEEDFSAPGRSEEVRQVFSKIPRVGRSVRSVHVGQ